MPRTLKDNKRKKTSAVKQARKIKEGLDRATKQRSVKDIAGDCDLEGDNRR